MSYQQISASEFARTASTGCVLDVRTPIEVRTLSLPGSVNIPLQELTPERATLAFASRGQPAHTVYLLCQGGRRATQAAEQLQANTSINWVVIDGGIDALANTNLPLIRQRNVISLERQVRIAAGFLVLLGVLLGANVNMGFYWLSGFVGAGLMFAGLSNTCMLGMLIAKAPWNR